MKQEITVDGKEITVVGTAHVSEESRREVRQTIEEVQPDLVGIELDEDRLNSLREDSGWKDLDLSEAIKEGKAPLLLVNLFLSIYQRHLGIQEGTKPGQEMLEAVEAAEENSIEYSLLDRDINETLSRAFSQLTIWEKIKLTGSIFAGKEEMNVEELKEGDMLDGIVSELEKQLPSLNKVFLEERNTFMAEKLMEQDFDRAVVVVGAAHVKGMIEDIEEQKKYSIQDGKSISWTKIISYGVPAFIIAGLGYAFYQIGFSTGVDATAFWILSNGILAMFGAIIARSHISTWITSFIAAPLTSLDPALGAGMVASYAEAKFHPPTIEEMEEVTKVENYRSLWDNQAGRVLLTFFFVTLGSAAATFLSAGFIASLIGL
ncbi:TraB/GumN family protein [Candidatus Nanohalobium constans]|uniref:Conjugal transfer protein TraB n=1 Tax=Candidatus Nanohalobium constans TaxID=2565781 RepID=A0A5Q0UFQ5_9ARCH|nr:TraB/GumN family protein [Candidatus Nanohalobium constans]QGA80417.1 conjugal transfer protein TraB [Candidatus Nanohalobium constans]